MSLDPARRAVMSPANLLHTVADDIDLGRPIGRVHSDTLRNLAVTVTRPRTVYVIEVLGRMDGTYVFADRAEADRFAGCFLQGQVWAGELPVLTTADGVIAAEQE